MWFFTCARDNICNASARFPFEKANTSKLRKWRWKSHSLNSRSVAPNNNGAFFGGCWCRLTASAEMSANVWENFKSGKQMKVLRNFSKHHWNPANWFTFLPISVVSQWVGEVVKELPPKPQSNKKTQKMPRVRGWDHLSLNCAIGSPYHSAYTYFTIISQLIWRAPSSSPSSSILFKPQFNAYVIACPF